MQDTVETLAKRLEEMEKRLTTFQQQANSQINNQGINLGSAIMSAKRPRTNL